MCGIIGAFNHGENKEMVNEWIVNQLEDQLNRGEKGFGVLHIDNKLKIKVERATEITKSLLDLRFNPSSMILMHHRWPTSSENKISQTHPIKVSNGSLKYDYYVIHNGIVHNEDKMRKKHIDELGFLYTTDRKTNTGVEEFNDSEALAIELARFIEGQTSQIETTGSAAYIVLRVDKKKDVAVGLFFGRNNNPLNMAKTRGKLRLSSEGEGDPIKEDVMYSCNVKDFKLSKKPCIIKLWQPAAATTTDFRSQWRSGYEDNSYGRETYRPYGLNEEPAPVEEKTDTEEAVEELTDRIHTITDDCIDFIMQGIENEGSDDPTLPEYIDMVFAEAKAELLKGRIELAKTYKEQLLTEEEDAKAALKEEEDGEAVAALKKEIYAPKPALGFAPVSDKGPNTTKPAKT